MNTTTLTAALALCDNEADRDLPDSIAELEQLKARFAAYGHGQPGVNDLAERLVSAPVADFEAVLDDVALEYARRQFIAATNTNGWRGIHLNRISQQAWAQALPEIHARLLPVFTTAVDRLTRAAGKLPDGPAALDPEAVLAANAGSHYHSARDAVRQIGTIAAAFDAELHQDGSTPHGSQVAVVTAIPQTEVQVLHPFSSQVITPNENRANIGHIRRLVKTYATDPQQTILDVARGTYGENIRLDLATSDQVAERVDNISRAHKARRAREHDDVGSDRGWTPVA